MDETNHIRDMTAFWKHCTTALGTMLLAVMGNTVADYGQFVKKEELPIIAPFAGEPRARIALHIKNSESALKEILASLKVFNQAMQKQAHAADMRLTILEGYAKRKN